MISNITAMYCAMSLLFQYIYYMHEKTYYCNLRKCIIQREWWLGDVHIVFLLLFLPWLSITITLCHVQHLMHAHNKQKHKLSKKNCCHNFPDNMLTHQHAHGSHSHGLVVQLGTVSHLHSSIESVHVHMYNHTA